jgi:hypothetical protein
MIHLDYPLDKKILLEEAHKARKSARGYTDDRYPDLKLDDWLIGHHSSDYINKIIADFEVDGRARFYWLEPYAEIPEHVDNGTLCSLNFILTDNAAPITMNGQEFFYDQILLDTTVPHSVKNNQFERIMLKISIFNENFSSVSSRIKYKK